MNRINLLGPLPQNAFGPKLFITPPSTARLVDRMEGDGWVERRPDPQDRRMKRIVLTARAEEVCPWESSGRGNSEVHKYLICRGVPV